MALVRMIAHGVFGCFWKIERLADRLTGKAGPVFVALAAILIAMATFTYFNVIYPLAFLRPDCDALVALLSLLLSLYLATCTAIHYYFACTVPPGSPSEPTSLSRPFRTSRPWYSRVIRRLLHRPVRPTIGTAKQEMIEQHRMRINRYCTKCLKSGIKGIDGRGPIKPERAHHCRVCGICQLKYDHHCPWINQCVGLRNERYFLLFLLYMTVSCGWIVYWGWLPFMESLNFAGDWPFWSPRVCVVLTWVLAVAIGVTIGIMFGWQLLLIGKGETTVESSDNDYYRKLFASRGQTFQNPFDLGLRSNLQLFFNIGPGRSRWFTVLIPIRVAPSSDGWSWPKRAGWESQVIEMAEELTDDEEEAADRS